MHGWIVKWTMRAQGCTMPYTALQHAAGIYSGAMAPEYLLVLQRTGCMRLKLVHSVLWLGTGAACMHACPWWASTGAREKKNAAQMLASEAKALCSLPLATGLLGGAWRYAAFSPHVQPQRKMK